MNELSTPPILTIYTDGSCKPRNPGPGGAAVICVICSEIVDKMVYSEAQSTNNRMEMMAAIMAFNFVEKYCDKIDNSCIIYTDSKYVERGISERAQKWKVRGWKTTANKPVKNVDLWEKLLKLSESYPFVQFKWIKAHNGDKYNTVVDEMAKNAAISQQ